MKPEDTDKFAADLAERGRLAEEIDVIDKEIMSLCKEQELLFKAVKNSSHRDELPAELQAVFDEAQELFVVMNRIRQEEERIKQEAEKVRSDIILLLKSNQQAGKIVKYRNALEPGLPAGSLLDEKHRKA